jgi:hypothetical protein
MSRLALTCLILAVAALTRSPDVVAWVLVGISAVWLASYYLREAMDRLDADIARVLAQGDADFADSRDMDAAVLLGSGATLAELEFAASVWADIDELEKSHD